MQLVLLTIVTMLNITSHDVTYFMTPFSVLPTLPAPLRSGNHQSVL